MIRYLKNENLDDLIANKRVVLDFYADWCGPCQILGEMLEDVCNNDRAVEIVKINVDEHEDLAMRFGVMSIPLLVLYDGEKFAKKQMGVMEKEELIEWIK